MVELWFAIASVMITAFVVLDGWDFGAGALHLIVARTDAERRTVLRAIGPLWGWNEVWLLSAGGVLFLAFPKVLASAFAGTYLALFLVLWALVLRGISIEARGQLQDPMWHALWDFGLCLSSVLLAVLFGAALGNTVRGFPIDQSGEFSLPFFTDFGVRGRLGLLDWYTVTVGLFATVALANHGAAYLAWRTQGPVEERSRGIGRVLWILVLVLLPVVTSETFFVRPGLFETMLHRPIAWLGVVAAAVGMIGGATGTIRGHELRAFLCSCAFLAGMLVAAAAAVFPDMLHSTLGSEHSITAYSAAANEHGLAVALVWWPVALVLSVAYAVFVSRHFRGKVSASDEGHGY
jgi:cytochrome d ubiquinol oxidase subunit II